MVRGSGRTAPQTPRALAETPAQRQRAARLARLAQVARLRAAGLSVRQIARRLNHARSTIFKDLGVLGLRGGGPAARDARSGRFLTPAIAKAERTSTVTKEAPAPPSRAKPGAARQASTQRAAPKSPEGGAVALAGRLGDLAGAYMDALQRQLVEVREQLAGERRRHAQELAAAKALGDRRCRELAGRLALQTARADELMERVALAERRAEVAIGERRALTAGLASTGLATAQAP